MNISEGTVGDNIIDVHGFRSKTEIESLTMDSEHNLLVNIERQSCVFLFRFLTILCSEVIVIELQIIQGASQKSYTSKLLKFKWNTLYIYLYL